MVIQFFLIKLFLLFHPSLPIYFDVPKGNEEISVGITSQFFYKVKWPQKEGVQVRFYLYESGENNLVLVESEKRGVVLTNGEHWQTAIFVIEVITTNSGKMVLPVIGFNWMATNVDTGVLERFHTNISVPPFLVKEARAFIGKRHWIIGKWILLLMGLASLVWFLKSHLKVKRKKKCLEVSKLLWGNFTEMIKSKETLRFQLDKKPYFLFLLDLCRQFNEQAIKVNCPTIPNDIFSALEELENEIKFSPNIKSSKIEIRIAEFDKYVKERSQLKGIP